MAFGGQDNLLADAIGSLFMNFAVFDNYLNVVISVQLDLSKTQWRALVVPLNPRQKVEMITWFAKKHWPSKEVEELKELCKRSRELIEYRNDIAHGHIVVSDDEQGLDLVTFGGAHRFDPHRVPFDTETVAHAAMNALHLAKEMRVLAAKATKLRDDPPPPDGKKKSRKGG
jgi:hypothetical protein